jgi:hypothetical protein
MGSSNPFSLMCLQSIGFTQILSIVAVEKWGESKYWTQYDFPSFDIEITFEGQYGKPALLAKTNSRGLGQT